MSLGVRWGSIAALALIPLSPRSAPADPPARAAYVISSNDAQITRVDLDTGSVLPNVATVGSIANRVEVSPDRDFALVVNSGSDEISIFDTESESVIGTVPLPTGSNPWTVEISGTRAFATGLLTDRVYELDLSSASVTDSVSTGVAPEGMCTAQGKLYVANTGFHFDTFLYDPGTVSVFDADDLSPIATFGVGLNPQECLLAPDGTVHVVCTGDFGANSGSVHVIDPSSDAPVDTLDVAGYPGGGAVTASGTVFLNLTTFAFGSEIWAYESASRTWVNDGSNPLLASFDFYGNPRVDELENLLVPDFSADLLLVETPSTPGSPDAHLVGDGPVDVAVVERGRPVPVAFSGLSATNVEAGIRLVWHATPEADLDRFVVERRAEHESDFRTVAAEVGVAREVAWLDERTEEGVSYSYRVGGIAFGGGATWLPPVTVRRTFEGRSRLAIEGVSPNPARGARSIRFRLPEATDARVELFDTAGRRVTTLAAGSWPRGSSIVEWSGHDAAGRQLAPGAYFVCVEAGGERAVARLIVVR